jgi:hypothetical protein
MAKESINEKVVVLPDDAPGAVEPDIDVSTYHETHAGSLVLDPTCVCSFYFPCLYARSLAAKGRRALSLATRSRPA